MHALSWCRELCDIGDIGKLTREQFALALHFINQKLSKGAEPPQTLTPEMIPPSDRNTQVIIRGRPCISTTTIPHHMHHTVTKTYRPYYSAKNRDELWNYYTVLSGKYRK